MRKTDDKDYELPARFTDIVVFRETPPTPRPKWEQEIWDKIHAAKTDEEANELLDIIYGPDEEFDRIIELFENSA